MLFRSQAANDRYNAGLSTAVQGVGNLAQISIANANNDNQLAITKQMYPNTSNALTNPVPMGNSFFNSRYSQFGVQPDGSYVNFGSYKPKINPFTGKTY